MYRGNGELKNLVEHIYYTTKDVRQFNNLIMYAVVQAGPLIDSSKITKLGYIQGLSDTQSFVTGLSELELALLIAASRVEVKLETETINFNIAYDEYVEMAKVIGQERSRATSGLTAGASYRIWSKDVARSAWERLEEYDLVLPLSTNSKGTDASRDDIRMVKVDTGLLELGNMIGKNHQLHKWTRL